MKDKIQISSLYGEMKPKTENEHEYGCTVCKHRVSCEPNPFGICEEFERGEPLYKKGDKQ